MAIAELSPLFASIKAYIPDEWEATYQYHAVMRAGRVTHQWCLSSKLGGVHVHGWRTLYGDRHFHEWMGGIEVHLPHRGEYGSETPSHEHCWLIDGPCWHDGTSLGFSEQVAPYLPEDTDELRDRDHIQAVAVLASWFRAKIVEQGDDA